MPTEKLLIFGRYPRIGQVKTRLAPFLTDSGCYQLHLALLLDTVERTSRLDVKRYFYIAGCSQVEAHAFALHHSLGDIQICIQHGSDLGERMWQAYTEIRKRDDRVVFLGTDSPSVPLSYIRSAFETLSRVNVVLGPVADGGYFLLGLSSPQQELFRNISWGSSQVFRQTLAKLSDKTHRILPEWYDIDLKEDLNRLAGDLESEFEGYPRRTRSFMENWGISGSKADHR